jgi:membrane protein implicated in regulation of membrane protease activity
MLGKDAVVVICDGRSGLVRLDRELCGYRARDLLAAGDRVQVVEIDASRW